MPSDSTKTRSNGRSLTSAPGGVEPRHVIDLRTRPRALKTSEKVARDLASYIVDEQLAEGTMLSTEKVMAESLGVGRTTMREALRLLEIHGVLTIRPGPGGGPVVRRPKPNDLSESLTLLLQFKGATLEEVIKARAELEPIVARTAVPSMGRRPIDELIVVNEEYAQTSGDAIAGATANRRFHSIIADHSDNVALRIFTESLIRIAHSNSGGVVYTPRRLKQSVESHQRIIDAFIAKDPDAVQTAMRDHVDESSAFWRRQYGDLITRPVRWE
jgi:GntR family transcriptional repressor for pyruvate dehydrogenase complex